MVDWHGEGRDGHGAAAGTRGTAGADLCPGASVPGSRPANPGSGFLPSRSEPGRSFHGLRRLGPAGLRHGPERGQLAGALHQLGQRAERPVCLCGAAADGCIRAQRDGAPAPCRHSGHPVPVPVLANGQKARRPGHGTVRSGAAGDRSLASADQPLGAGEQPSPLLPPAGRFLSGPGAGGSPMVSPSRRRRPGIGSLRIWHGFPFSPPVPAALLLPAPAAALPPSSFPGRSGAVHPDGSAHLPVQSAEPAGAGEHEASVLLPPPSHSDPADGHHVLFPAEPAERPEATVEAIGRSALEQRRSLRSALGASRPGTVSGRAFLFRIPDRPPSAGT